MIILTKWNKNRGKRTKLSFIFFQFFRIIGQECKKKNRKVEQVLSLTLIPFNPSHRYQSFLPLNPGRQTATQAAKHVANIIVPPSEPLMFAKFHRRLSPARLGDSPFIPIRIERHRVSWPRFDLMIFNPSADVNVTVAGREI